MCTRDARPANLVQRAGNGVRMWVTPRDEEAGCSSWGCLAALVALLLAFGLMYSTLRVQHPADPLCDGLLGAGFPVAFICDDVSSSPTSGWGRIESGDFYNFSFYGCLVDLGVYLGLLGIGAGLGWWIIRRVRYRGRSR